MNDEFPGFREDGPDGEAAQEDGSTADADFPGFQEPNAPRGKGGPPPDVGPKPSPAKIFDDAPAAPGPQPDVGPKPSPAKIFDDDAAPAGPETAGAAVADEDVRPGARDDLWPCPHCGVRNKPERETCRKCGKRPTDPREAPWFLKPKVLGTIVAVLAAIVLVIYIITRPDLDLSPADPARIDAAVRYDRSGGETVDTIHGDFRAVGRFSVCGRVVSVRRSEDAPTVICLVTAAAVRDDVHLDDLADEGGSRVGIKNAYGFNPLAHARLRVADSTQSLEAVRRLGVLSVTGSYGELDELRSDPDGGSWVVTIDRLAFAER